MAAQRRLTTGAQDTILPHNESRLVSMAAAGMSACATLG
jgi:hypothetical protein